MKIILSITAIIFLSITSELMAENRCGKIRGFHYGPYDYINPEHRKNNLPVVEAFHFSKNIENLISSDNGTIAGNLSYVLRAFPNHHRALISMSKYSLREKSLQPDDAQYSVTCYFERAMRFKPNDPMVRSIFSGHLLKMGQVDMAIEQLLIAEELDPNNPAFNYNLGLLFFDKKDYSRSREYAEKAYAQEFPLPGLKNKLQNAGKW